MTDLAPLYAALKQADAAGDAVGASKLADYIRQNQAPRFATGRSLDAVGDETFLTGSPAAIAARSPVSDNAMENAAAGYGKAGADLVRGAGQYVGAVSRQDVADSRERDAPLMATTAGKIGNFAGNVADTLPALAIPGANTVAGAAALGAGLGALQPSTSTGETATNIGLGGLVGGAGQAVAGKLAGYATQKIADRAANAVTATSQNAVRDATLAASQKAGYVVPPTSVNPSLANTALESASGRYATKQAAMVKNQPVTNSLAKADLGIPDSQPITQTALQGIRDTAGQVYKQVKGAGQITADAPYQAEIAGISNASQQVQSAFPGAATPAGDKIDALVKSLAQPDFSAAQAVEYTKRLRSQASGNFKLAGRSGDPEPLALAHAQIDGANALEEMIGRHLSATGQPDLLKEWQTARTQIAKTYTVDAALNDATGNVDAKVLARQLDKKKPLSGGLKTAAQFAQAFDEVAGEPVKGPGVSKLAYASALGGLATGHPALAALPVVSTLARKTLLARPVNQFLAQPNYAPGSLGTLALKGLQQSPNLPLPLSPFAPRLVNAEQ